MSAPVKFLIGLLAALLLGWIWHGPAGQGEAFAGAMEAQVKMAAAQAELPGVAARIERDPLTRRAVVSGEANDLQREGLGSQWGVLDYVRSVEGVAEVRWDDAPAGFRLPLLAETLILVAIAYAVGFGLAFAFFGRRRRESFLD